MPRCKPEVYCSDLVKKNLYPQCVIYRETHVYSERYFAKYFMVLGEEQGATVKINNWLNGRQWMTWTEEKNIYLKPVSGYRWQISDSQYKWSTHFKKDL